MCSASYLEDEAGGLLEPHLKKKKRINLKYYITTLSCKQVSKLLNLNVCILSFKQLLYIISL
jgi:hypothetical protein